MILGQTAATAAVPGDRRRRCRCRRSTTPSCANGCWPTAGAEFDRPPLSEARRTRSRRAASTDDAARRGRRRRAAKLTGDWQPAASVGPFVGDGYRHDGNAEKGKRPPGSGQAPTAGRYEVRACLHPQRQPGDQRPGHGPPRRRRGEGEGRTSGRRRAIDKLWVSLGTFEFAADKPAVVEVTNDGTDGYVIIDAVQFLPTK